MSKVKERVQCPQCSDSSQDNLVIYHDDSSYCFACGYYENTTGNENETQGESMEAEYKFLNGFYKDIHSRGISKSTCEFFKYEVYKNEEDGTAAHIANYFDLEGNKIFQKIRKKGKEFYSIGSNKNSLLYGQWLWNPDPNKPVVVVEGEIDALSIVEITGKMFPVVSVPNGANSAIKSLKANLDWLVKFKEVLIGFDSDDPGIAASQECLSLFEPGKVKLIHWPTKDANDLLKSGKGYEIDELIRNAKSIRPDKIVSIEDITLVKPKYGLSWPWRTLTDLSYGIQNKSIYTVGAGSGIGKTEFMKDILLHLVLSHQEKVGALFLEQSPDQTLLRILGGLVGKRLHIPGTIWNHDEINKARDTLKDKIYFYDHFGGQDIEVVFQKVRYLVKGLGCHYIFLDHLTALAAEMKDERKGIDLAMSKLGSLVHELDCTIFLVSHLAKPSDGPSYEEGRVVTASSFRGSQSIQYWSAFMLGLERNKLAESEEERTITKVRVLKDRFAGEADGCTFDLKYNRETGHLEEYTSFFTDDQIEVI